MGWLRQIFSIFFFFFIHFFPTTSLSHLSKKKAKCWCVTLSLVQVDTFFAVGSPLGLFLALRNIRFGASETFSTLDFMLILVNYSWLFFCPQGKYQRPPLEWGKKCQPVGNFLIFSTPLIPWLTGKFKKVKKVQKSTENVPFFGLWEFLVWVQFCSIVALFCPFFPQLGPFLFYFAP